MTVWVMFVWVTVGATYPGVWSYETKAECDEAAGAYKRAVCVPVKVTRPK